MRFPGVTVTHVVVFAMDIVACGFLDWVLPEFVDFALY